MDTEGTVTLSASEKVKHWLKDPWHLALLGILVLAFIIRIYFFSATAGQPLWWDEAEYLDTAKHWVYDVPYTLNPQRPPLFQALAALVYLLGGGEDAIKFLLVILPSLLLVVACYALGKEMYDKRIGVLAALFAAVSWEFLFWTARVQPDFFSMLFQVLAIQQMWKYWKTPHTKSIILAGIFAALGFHFKVSGLLIPILFGVFMLIKDRLSAFTNKHYYYFAVAFLATLAPYLLWARLTFGNALAFQGGFQDQIVNAVPFGWYNIGFFYTVSTGLLFALFIIGALFAFKFLLYLDVLAKEKNRCFDADIFSILALIIISAFYIFYIRYTEDRWVFLWLPFIFLLAARAIVSIYQSIKVYHQTVAAIVVILCLLVVAYTQAAQANTLIVGKQQSYQPVKEAGLWIKDHSSSGDLVITQSQTQITYYAERGVNHFTAFKNASAFDEYIARVKPRYFIVSAYESKPQWIPDWNTWLAEHQSILNPVYAQYGDAEKKQMVLAIYELKNASTS